MDLERLKSIFAAVGLKPQAYSGRGMYGKQCLAVVVDDHPFGVALALAYQAVPHELEELLAILFRPQEDQMGQNVVLYWPHIAWSDDV